MRIEVTEEEAVYLLNSQKDEIRILKAERDEARREQSASHAEWGRCINERNQALRDLEKVQTVARRLYHDWDARTVRSLQEIADENPWILEERDL